MVDSNVILRRVGRIRKCVANLESIRRVHPEAKFLADELAQAAAERNIQVLDVCNHIVADMKLEVPDEERQAFQILASHKLIPQGVARTLSSMAGIRNILVHEYLEVDHRLLYSIMKQRLGDFEKFIKAILKLL